MTGVGDEDKRAHIKGTSGSILGIWPKAQPRTTEAASIFPKQMAVKTICVFRVKGGSPEKELTAVIQGHQDDFCTSSTFSAQTNVSPLTSLRFFFTLLCPTPNYWVQ